ncbi:uncharacterized protein Smp_202030 [Schistosoma mansoni]|uniref:uncharacterized protein n=1 Tax=Schistosoma mansoni TaxID=6183 RepID=UPI00022DC215|nr:uncharacterized protein Smp_202030 [Schistosoma mansoni]|eukprot:XP_018650924.1 uncharacterized protein Smp_202030 [Schistosoma mansoni]
MDIEFKDDAVAETLRNSILKPLRSSILSSLDGSLFLEVLRINFFGQRYEPLSLPALMGQVTLTTQNECFLSAPQIITRNCF